VRNNVVKVKKDANKSRKNCVSAGLTITTQLGAESRVALTKSKKKKTKQKKEKREGERGYQDHKKTKRTYAGTQHEKKLEPSCRHTGHSKKKQKTN